MKVAVKPVILVSLAISLVIVSGLITYGYFSYNRILSAPAGSGESRLFSVAEGESAEAVSRRLKDDGLIKDALVFSLYLKHQKLAGQIKAGTYLLSPASTPKEIAEAITEGKVAKLKVTIPEGFWLSEAGERLERDKIVSRADFEAALKLDWSRYPSVAKKPANVDLEGYLFPDTYIFNYGASAEVVVATMMENLEKKLAIPEVASGISGSGFSIHQVLTLASMVEAEAKFDEDRPKVAEVFRNRLARGMRLESDPTAGYALKKRKVTRSDLSVNSPYNTYRIAGLPPGPINSPGLSSIKAAISKVPAFGDGKVYLYFCSPDSGKVYYATTFSEHQANIANFCSK